MILKYTICNIHNNNGREHMQDQVHRGDIQQLKRGIDILYKGSKDLFGIVGFKVIDDLFLVLVDVVDSIRVVLQVVAHIIAIGWDFRILIGRRLRFVGFIDKDFEGEQRG